ncbi:MAG: hypothetical protein K0B81_00345 [Candidatus Cloacimonetes bacterium]|nr:hypothetical protein [Candidatus Cloacimonadota bacterium]
MSVLRKIKDNTLVKVLKPFINSYLSDIGTLKEIKLDSNTKSLLVVIDLKGESSPIKINILKYELEKKGNQHYLIVKKIDFSREWINLAIKKWRPDMRVPIPPAIATVVLK